MLRITVEASEDLVALKMEGRVVDSMIGEIRRAWQNLEPSLGMRKFAVDLRGVTFVDAAGRRLLAEIHTRTGAEFLANTPMTKYFAEEAMHSGRFGS